MWKRCSWAGSVHRAGGVEVHLELVNAADGRRIWGTRFDRPISQLLAFCSVRSPNRHFPASFD